MEYKIQLRTQYEKETSKIATDNIADYADWLENRLVKLNEIFISPKEISFLAIKNKD